MNWAPLFVMLTAPSNSHRQAIAESLAFSQMPALGKDQQMLYAALSADENIRRTEIQEKAVQQRGETQAITEVTGLLNTVMQSGTEVEVDDWPILARHVQVLNTLSNFTQQVRHNAISKVREQQVVLERKLLEDFALLLEAARNKPKTHYLSEKDFQEVPELYKLFEHYDLLEQILRVDLSPSKQEETSIEEAV